MHVEVDEDAAWLAFEEGRLEDADRIWSELITGCEDEAERDRLVGHRAYVLVAERRFDEARSVYASLYAKNRSHRDLHQIGMVEREAGELNRAIEIFTRERSAIPDDDSLAVAANTYERSLVHHLLGQREAALTLMEECLCTADRSEDPTMMGAAYRLKGDLLRDTAPDRARRAFARAKEYFLRAKDRFGVAELELRIEALPE